MATFDGASAMPPLPEYTLHPLPPLLPPVPDKVLSIVLPIVAYWAVSMFFHWIDVKDYWAKYRLHTPAEILKRNHVSRYDVARDVVVQQIIQTITGLILGLTEPTDLWGKEEFDIAVWAQRIRAGQTFIPPILAILSIDAKGLAKNLAAYPALAGVLMGGTYTGHNNTMALNGSLQSAPTFAAWELNLAKAVYWVIVPALQYFVAIVTMDTWQYFLHRAMHMNKWMYTTFHSRHHRLYVPYAYGALYNHPFEGFLLDTLGGAVSYKVAGLNTRQGMWFFTCSTIKTVDDHCGYALPWDPLQRITSNNAGYHDVHHQSWGIKTNFSQPFFTFWDRLLGTIWAGGDVSVRYERAALAAQKKLDLDRTPGQSITGSDPTASDNMDHGPYKDALANATELQKIPSSLQSPTAPPGKAEQQAASSRQQVLTDLQSGGSQILVEEAAEEEREAQNQTSRKGHTRRRTASSLTNSDSLRGLRERVSAHGRTGGILGMEHAH